MSKITWKLANPGVAKSYSDSEWTLKGTKIPVNANILSQKLSLSGNCDVTNSQMQAVCVSFTSDGTSGASYCDKNSDPFVHYADSFKVSPGLRTVTMKIQNGCGADINLTGAEFVTEYELPSTADSESEGSEPQVNDPVVESASRMTLKMKRIMPTAVIPTYAHNGDVGMDMTCVWAEYDPEYDQYIYHTGLAMESDYGFGVFLFPRSSNCKTDAYLTNHVGIVDTYLYRGEVQFRYKNRTPYRKSFKEWITGRVDLDRVMSKAPYRAGDRVGQMVVFPYPQVDIVVTDELSDTERGTGGFGSTGK